jgi:hypothetical protein
MDAHICRYKELDLEGDFIWKFQFYCSFTLLSAKEEHCKVALKHKSSALSILPLLYVLTIGVLD